MPTASVIETVKKAAAKEVQHCKVARIQIETEFSRLALRIMYTLNPQQSLSILRSARLGHSISETKVLPS